MSLPLHVPIMDSITVPFLQDWLSAKKVPPADSRVIADKTQRVLFTSEPPPEMLRSSDFKVARLSDGTITLVLALVCATCGKFRQWVTNPVGETRWCRHCRQASGQVIVVWQRRRS